MTERPNIFRMCIVLALQSAALGALTSCNIVAPAAYIIEGPGTIDPQYVLADRPTVVFVDDRGNLLSPAALRRDIALKVSEDLMVHECISEPNMIRPTDAMTVARTNDSASKLMSIDDIGRSVGAQQIIYVEVKAFQRSPDNFSPRPYALTHVRVVDIENRTRLFPAPDDSGSSAPAVPVQTVMQPITGSEYDSRSSELAVYKALALEVGRDIGELFYEHERVDLGGNLNPR
jgi:hypothetical protein